MRQPIPALVRQYRADDREQVLALAPRLTEGVAAWRDPEAVGRAVCGWVTGSLETAAEPGHAVFVAELGGRIAGVVTVAEKAHFTGQVDAYVGELAVAAGSARRGVATQLMSAVDAWAAQRGLAFVTLETGAANEPARNLYAGLGFLDEDVRLTKPVAGA
jgi:ribosomal protein S18 acetylase RimI-like enzyme